MYPFPSLWDEASNDFGLWVVSGQNAFQRRAEALTTRAELVLLQSAYLAILVSELNCTLNCNAAVEVWWWIEPQGI